MYFFQKLRGASCPWATSCVTAIDALPSLRLLRQPRVKRRLARFHDHRPAHDVVPDPAQFGAGELILAGGRGGEPRGREHAGDDVLLHAEVRQKEAVENVRT